MKITDHYPPSPDPAIEAMGPLAGPGTLFRQAPMSAQTYLGCAIIDIDQALGKGYAKDHPELIAAYMQSAAIDYGTSLIARAIELLGEKLESSSGIVVDDGMN